MRELTSHKVNGLNESLKIEVLDEPGPGGACHAYRIAVPNGTAVSRGVCCDIEFQNGPIGEVGIRGLSNEALLAVVEDRLKGFQSGAFACRENALALTHLQDAMHWLHHRTRERIQRGVEGTSAK
ncbi:MAG: hypothetical protein IT428_31425 [Planctomycetaceae bacterium]|nr:hypothetical protein [Planctomycetaceae bacterium]